MRYVISLVALLFAVSLSTQVIAQGRGKGQANRPATGSTGGAKAGQAKPRADHPKPHTNQPNAGKKPTTTPSATSHGKSDTVAKGNPHKTPTTTTVTPTTPVAGAVKNPRLEAKLLALLPAGTNIQDAAQGFKNMGQFVAAVHVSNNLGLPFDSLKAAMTSPTAPMSLGQAIQSLGGPKTPDGDKLTQTKINNEVKKAENAASRDLRQASESN